MFAQSMVEYGAIAGIVTSAGRLWDDLSYGVSDVPPRMWVLVGIVAFALLVAFRSGRAR